MQPVFLDFHIHTSDDPENLNQFYDVDTLKSKIEDIASGSEYLIAFSDHNTVNKTAYLNAINKIKNLLVGVELHVRNYPEAKPYHCHILFNLDKIDEPTIDDINNKLDELYPKKQVTNDDEGIPSLQEIINKFDKYEFILMPHGGQNHSTFDKSIPKGVDFDNTVERSIYYNHFEGFTARSNTGLERTHEYFKKLGINDFVNLVTTTDNYEPKNYPDCKAGREASEFVPTWMLANPTFNGLRLSLSESSRLKYGEKPDLWAEFIQKVDLKNENIDINITLTPGLNVVIGGSSSGKSLLVDSMYRKISNDDFSASHYLKTNYGVQDINVTHPAGQRPHYLHQNYIMTVCNPDDKENNIDSISILKSIFPSDEEETLAISNGLSELGSQLSLLIQSVKEIENLQDILATIPNLSGLIISDVVQGNPLRHLRPNDDFVEKIDYNKAKYKKDIRELNGIDSFLSQNPLVSHDKTLIDKLKAELLDALEKANIELSIREIIQKYEHEIDENQKAENLENATKSKHFDTLLEVIVKYKKYQKQFENSLKEISKFKINRSTKKIESMGHKLFIENDFELTKDKFIEVIDSMLKVEIENFEDIKPEDLFSVNFKKRDPKVQNYRDLERKIKTKFEGMNKKKYRIITKEGKDYDDLSAGWKTAVILDLILDCDNNNAPLIIDQPEDNLATSYINTGLLSSIKKCKSKKQIILVSHNATIPMLGDAQNIIMCENDDNKIKIRSNPLEGIIDEKRVVDLIADITDGGKSSVKKRFKKYDLKKYRGESETAIQ